MSAASSSSASASGGGVPSLRLAAPAPPSAASRRIPPPCWTHEETGALIDCYRDKWYSLRRGNLRASHWDDVADAVDRRCHHLPAATPKTPVQCRHKVEKLRKRYRAERQRSLARDSSAPPVSAWVYFPKMDAMERGVGSGSAPAALPSPSLAPAPASSDDDEIEDDYPDRRMGGGTTRSLHRLLANGGGSGGLKFDIPKAVRSRSGLNPNNSGRSFSGFAASKPGLEEMRRRLEKKRTKRKEREREREGEAVGEMVAALRMLGDGFMRTEQMKMEMARETEKVRMEMELKRTETMLDCQRQMVDSLLKGFTTKKKKKANISPDP